MRRRERRTRAGALMLPLLLLLLPLGLGLGGCADDDADDGPVGEASAYATTHGFSFPNYGNTGVVNLTPVEVQRLYGDAVCAKGAGPTCVLSPTARRFMEYSNARMAGGHCFGLASLSIGFWATWWQPIAFDPAAKSPFELALQGAELLQREVAFQMMLQTVVEVRSQEFGAGRSPATPNEVLAMVEAGLAAGDRFILGLDKPGRGAHAVVAFAVRQGGAPHLRNIIIYDSNFPGRETEVVIDTVANTWRYEYAATRAGLPLDVWSGDADSHTLSALPGKALANYDAAKVQCPISLCGTFAPKTGGERTMIAVGHNADIVVSNAAGQKAGQKAGQTFSEIPGATAQVLRGGLWDDEQPPALSLPATGTYDVTLTSPDDATPAEIWWEGPGFVVGVEDIYLGPEVEDRIHFDAGEASIRYRTTEAETATVSLNALSASIDWRFEITSAGEDDGQIIDAELDLEARVLYLQLDDFEESSKEATFDLVIERFGHDSDEDDLDFVIHGVQIPYGAELALLFGKWDRGTDALLLRVDLDGDGYDEADGDYTVDLLDEDP